MNDLEIRRVVYGLLQAGLVEVIRPVGQDAPTPGRMFPTSDRDEQRTLVKKIDRAYSIIVIIQSGFKNYADSQNCSDRSFQRR